MCVSLSSATSATVLINGAAQTPPFAPSGLAGPPQITINGNTKFPATSTFGALELMTWGRALSSTELSAASAYLGARYGIALTTAAPVASMPPAPPLPPPPPYPALPSGSLSTGMVAWCAPATAQPRPRAAPARFGPLQRWRRRIPTAVAAPEQPLSRCCCRAAPQV
jgi:hypothetical protein